VGLLGIFADGLFHIVAGKPDHPKEVRFHSGGQFASLALTIQKAGGLPPRYLIYSGVNRGFMD